MVRPKKFLGQHFLTDQHVANRIVDALQLVGDANTVLEIGPGTGVLTERLLQKPNVHLHLNEIDRESIAYLKAHLPALTTPILEGDFLKLDVQQLGEKLSIIGNFPYNISSQIFFKVLQHKDTVQQVVCMLQKEVADRIAARHGNKTYGILSVFLQAFYDVDYLFKVPPGVFFPPPKVMSAVIRLRRNAVASLPCNEALFQTLVKQGFNMRRKTLRNALKPLTLPASVLALPLLDKRAEQLSVADFVSLTTRVEQSGYGVR
jgi:16S rRNA (adenine1518-N6/adenine1519-N6)-dimethyltransferase